jgi:peptidoglycan/xylan/chitin deacetylase (PgdA/CDA1 family)
MHKNKKLILWSGIIVCILSMGVIVIIQISSHYVAPIIMYHSVRPVVERKDLLAVSVKTFERQMRFLKSAHYSVVALEQMAAAVSQKKNLPGRVIAITFDDGNADNFTYAFPILKKYGLAATIFLIVDDIGKPDKLSWDQIRQMQGSGLITFGSHTISHPFLDCISSDSELIKEISGSKEKLEAGLGRSVACFAYPCGRLNSLARKYVIDAGYKAGAVTNPGKSVPDDDVFALKRLRISENASNLFVFWFETTGYYNFFRENKRKHK